MPTPIGANAAGVTIPPVHIEGDAGPALPLATPPDVTIPPVYIEGEAGPVERLVRGHDAAKAAGDCSSERATAAFGALEVAGAVGGTLLGATLGPLGVAAGLAAVTGLSYSEGQKLRALYDCETE